MTLSSGEKVSFSALSPCALRVCGEIFVRTTLKFLMSRYETFDRSRLEIKPLAERKHELQLSNWLALDDPTPAFEHPDLATAADHIRAKRGARILMMGAHVLRAGVNRHIIDL